jgi:glycine cleavage system H protein
MNVADTRIPDDLHYSEQDEWARSEGERVTVGITDYQQQLGDVVFVELRGGRACAARRSAIESVKAVRPLAGPGEVLLNEAPRRGRNS